MGLYNLREGCTGQEVVEGGSEKGVSARRPGDGWGSVRRGEARRAIPFLPALGNSIPRVWYMAVDVGFLLAAWKMTGPDHIHIHTHTRTYAKTHTHTHCENTFTKWQLCTQMQQWHTKMYTQAHRNIQLHVHTHTHSEGREEELNHYPAKASK